MGSGFSQNQAFRQTAALQAFARLSWRPEPVIHPIGATLKAAPTEDGGRGVVSRSPEPE
jgi:hypothetical protein